MRLTVPARNSRDLAELWPRGPRDISLLCHICRWALKTPISPQWRSWIFMKLVQNSQNPVGCTLQTPNCGRHGRFHCLHLLKHSGHLRGSGHICFPFFLAWETFEVFNSRARERPPPLNHLLPRHIHGLWPVKQKLNGAHFIKCHMPTHCSLKVF